MPTDDEKKQWCETAVAVFRDSFTRSNALDIAIVARGVISHDTKRSALLDDSMLGKDFKAVLAEIDAQYTIQYEQSENGSPFAKIVLNVSNADDYTYGLFTSNIDRILPDLRACGMSEEELYRMKVSDAVCFSSVIKVSLHGAGHEAYYAARASTDPDPQGGYEEKLNFIAHLNAILKIEVQRQRYQELYNKLDAIRVGATDKETSLSTWLFEVDSTRGELTLKEAILDVQCQEKLLTLQSKLMLEDKFKYEEIINPLVSLKAQLKPGEPIQTLANIIDVIQETVHHPTVPQANLCIKIATSLIKQGNLAMHALGVSLQQWGEAIKIKQEQEYQIVLHKLNKTIMTQKNKKGLYRLSKQILCDVCREHDTALKAKHSAIDSVLLLQLLDNALSNPTSQAGLACIWQGAQLQKVSDKQKLGRGYIVFGAVIIMIASLAIGLISGGVLAPLSLAGIAVGQGLVGGVTLGGVGVVIATTPAIMTKGYRQHQFQYAVKKQSNKTRNDLLELRAKEEEEKANALELCEDSSTKPLDPDPMPAP